MTWQDVIAHAPKSWARRLTFAALLGADLVAWGLCPHPALAAPTATGTASGTATAPGTTEVGVVKPELRPTPSATVDPPPRPSMVTARQDGQGFGAPLVWDPAWRHFGGADYWLTGAAGLTAAAMAIMPPLTNTMTGSNRLDDEARSTFRLSTLAARGVAADVSDVLLTSLSSYPMMVDALVVARWYRQSPQVAWELFTMDVEVLFVTGAIQGTATVLAGRERPYAPSCGTEVDANMRDCLSANRFRSFFSGHASQSFASAALLCTHHAHFPLYGGGLADAAPCVLGMLTAGSTAWLRIASDFHHASDVLTGALIGTLTGLGLPWLLHYRRREAPTRASAEQTQWLVMPTPMGIAVGGIF